MAVMAVVMAVIQAMAGAAIAAMAMHL